MSSLFITIGLLTLSNVFMTFLIVRPPQVFSQ